MISQIEKIIQESIQVKSRLPIEKIETACQKIILCYREGGKILICGNGGSAADSQHMAGEFVNRFKLERPALPCLSLTTDSSVLTSIANDYDFESIFSKQVQAYGQKKDILIGISTSGNSKNIIKAMNAAREKEMYSIGFIGNNGGVIKDLCDLPIIVSSSNTPRIQEAHELVIHAICEIVEKELYQ